MPMYDHARLLEIVTYDPETGIFTHNLSRGGTFAGTVAGHASKRDGYVRINIDRNLHLAHRMAWFYVNKVWPEDTLDHINGDRKDNRICNLRVATKGQNNFNKPLTKQNTSGYKGVSLNKQSGKWKAQIQVNGKNRYIGQYNDIREAAEAYIFAALDAHGEYARF